MKEVNTVVPQAESPIMSCVGAVSFCSNKFDSSSSLRRN